MRDLKRLGETLEEIKTLALLDTLANTLAEAKANTLNNTLVDIKTKALIYNLAVTLLDAEFETLGEK